MNLRSLRHASLLLAGGLLALLAGCKEVLFARLSEAQANEVIAALAESRIAVTKTRVDDVTWQVDVDGAVMGQALVLLRNRGLPMQPSVNLGEVFKKVGMISSPQEERARREYALQESIADTLRRIDGIVDARVHVAIPHNDPLSSRVIPASASVLVKHRPALDIGMLGPHIKSIVMSSVEGLDYRHIALLALPVERSALPDSPGRQPAGFMSAHAATQDATQQTASAEMLTATLAGLMAMGWLAWWLKRRRSDGPSLATAASEVDIESAQATASWPRPAPTPRRIASSAAPSLHPGLFDTQGPTQKDLLSDSVCAEDYLEAGSSAGDLRVPRTS